MPRSLPRVLGWCQEGYETLLAQEISGAALACAETGGGWVRTAETPTLAAPDDWCFAHAIFEDAREVCGGSVNALAGAVAEVFLDTARGERFEAPWPLAVFVAGGLDGLGRRAAGVEAAVRELLKKRMSRVARLATAGTPRRGWATGLFLGAIDFDRLFVARRAWFGGQRRMADDPAAPSRSYLKVEEAYGVLGREPEDGETVIDLGAAPGGWSFSAARRGARVIAVDNGPLKGGALGHPKIEHRREDAFRVQPVAGQNFDWLFCDLVEDPHHVLRSIVERWLRNQWCRHFVINLKFGRADALALLGDARRRVAPSCRSFSIRHLFHDREEFTLVGEVREP